MGGGIAPSHSLPIEMGTHTPPHIHILPPLRVPAPRRLYSYRRKYRGTFAVAIHRDSVFSPSTIRDIKPIVQRVLFRLCCRHRGVHNQL